MSHLGSIHLGKYFLMNKEGKKLLKNMKKHIPNFSSLGLQDLYENNQMYREF